MQHRAAGTMELLANAATILLVEDNEDDVEIARRTIARSGVAARLIVARDGREALASLRNGFNGSSTAPAVMLLDLLLPALHGTDVIREMRSDPRLACIPIVVVTGCTDLGLLRECMELGTNMYVLKPLDVADVMNILVGVKKFWPPQAQDRAA